jgi:hypothetical protein
MFSAPAGGDITSVAVTTREAQENIKSGHFEKPFKWASTNFRKRGEFSESCRKAAFFCRGNVITRERKTVSL